MEAVRSSETSNAGRRFIVTAPSPLIRAPLPRLVLAGKSSEFRGHLRTWAGRKALPAGSYRAQRSETSCSPRETGSASVAIQVLLNCDVAKHVL
jgi:hypothetical protein